MKHVNGKVILATSVISVAVNAAPRSKPNVILIMAMTWDMSASVVMAVQAIVHPTWTSLPRQEPDLHTAMSILFVHRRALH